MIAGPGLTLAAIGLQSAGKVLYGSFLEGIATPWFVLISVCLCALVFMLVSRARRLPRAPGLILAANLWTAIGFIGLFFALKHLPPAVFAAIEIGLSLIAALVLASARQRAWPPLSRSLACAGILAGCTLLAWDEIGAALAEPSPAMIVFALVASGAVGIASALSATACQRLAARGWSSASVLAHRFYLTIAVVLVWLLLPGHDPGPAFGHDATMEAVVLVFLTATLVVLIPALMLQIALRRTDALSVLVCMAAQPAIAFVLSMASPAYDWSAVTFAGVALVTLFVGLDLLAKQRASRLASRG